MENIAKGKFVIVEIEPWDVVVLQEQIAQQRYAVRNLSKPAKLGTFNAECFP